MTLPDIVDGRPQPDLPDLWAVVCNFTEATKRAPIGAKAFAGRTLTGSGFSGLDVVFVARGGHRARSWEDCARLDWFRAERVPAGHAVRARDDVWLFPRLADAEHRARLLAAASDLRRPASTDGASARRPGRLGRIERTSAADFPVWRTGGYRVHGYWLDTRRLGWVGLSPRGTPPVVYSWALDGGVAHGQEATLRAAKKKVEDAVGTSSANPTSGCRST